MESPAETVEIVAPGKELSVDVGVLKGKSRFGIIVEPKDGSLTVRTARKTGGVRYESPVDVSVLKRQARFGVVAEPGDGSLTVQTAGKVGSAQ